MAEIRNLKVQHIKIEEDIFLSLSERCFMIIQDKVVIVIRRKYYNKFAGLIRKIKESKSCFSNIGEIFVEYRNKTLKLTTKVKSETQKVHIKQLDNLIKKIGENLHNNQDYFASFQDIANSVVHIFSHLHQDQQRDIFLFFSGELKKRDHVKHSNIMKCFREYMNIEKYADPLIETFLKHSHGVFVLCITCNSER